LIHIESEVNNVQAAAVATMFVAMGIGPNDADQLNALVHLCVHTKQMADDLMARWNEAFAAA